MGSPYRSSQLQGVDQTPRDAGIVGDIISQFADRYAFLRELVQNAIDADTAAVDVAIAPDATGNVVTVSVTDHGEGMSRDVIENRLLVLFRSTKENDDSKIGKFGVGFASVLAVEPRVVRVDSVHEGARHILHLYSDLSYELFDAGRAARTGTTVELEVVIDSEQVEEFVVSSRQALSRWCRHARIPISLVVRDGAGRAVVDERIDRPLGLERPLIEVESTSPDGNTRVVVGIVRGGETYCGFFNHGLTLHETEEPLLGRLAVKIQDSRLGHTLSRDNVRRDENFDRAVSFAGRVAKSRLPAVASRALEQAALARDPALYRELSTAVVDAGLSLPAESWRLPLAAPLGGAWSTDGRAFAAAGAWTSEGLCDIVEALARRQIPVVDVSSLSDDESGAEAATRLEHITGTHPTSVRGELTLVCPVELSNHDLVLMDRLGTVLESAYRRPSAILIATLQGALADRMVVAGDRTDGYREPRGVEPGELEAWLLEQRGALRNPLARLRRPALVLNARSSDVASARERARTCGVTASCLLARAILSDQGQLDEGRSDRILREGLQQLVGTGL